MNAHRVSTRALFGPILQSRGLCAGLAGAAAAHVGLQLAGLSGWPCPMRLVLGIPCPGCGVGRACAALLRGNWPEGFRLHAFAPVVLIGLTLLTLGALVPTHLRIRLARRVGEWERRTAITPILLGALLLYWIARLALDGRPTIQLLP